MKYSCLKFCWGNPVFEAEFIRRMLEKAEEDFQSDPENTRLCFRTNFKTVEVVITTEVSATYL